MFDQNGCALRYRLVTSLFSLLLNRLRWVEYVTTHPIVCGPIVNPAKALQEKVEERSHGSTL